MLKSVKFRRGQRVSQPKFHTEVSESLYPYNVWSATPVVHVGVTQIQTLFLLLYLVYATVLREICFKEQTAGLDLWLFKFFPVAYIGGPVCMNNYSKKKKLIIYNPLVNINYVYI